MTIKFRCDCGIRIKAPDAIGGKTVKCPACHEQVTVPRLGEDPDSYAVSGTSESHKGQTIPYERKKLEKRNPSPARHTGPPVPPKRS